MRGRTSTVNALPYRSSRAPVAPRPRQDSAGRAQGIILCVLLTAAALLGTAQVGDLRLVDLVISAAVMAGVIALAHRDSRHLTTAIVAVWIFSRFVRRVVDWQTGGYTSLTALSLLPMLATAALVIPLLPRWRYVQGRLRLPLGLMVIPVVVASVIGLVRYGPSAAPEAGGWLLPILFVPYLATRPMTDGERWSILRACVLLCAASALYGIYQFLFLPPWDALWLVESGMTSSMGQPEPLKMRVWGTLSSAGTAGAVWALALIAAFADRGWRPAVRAVAITLLTGGLMITLVRGGWVMAAVGVVCFIMFSRGRDGLKVAAVALLAGVILIFVTPHLPGGERIGDRLQTFQELDEDQSVNARISITTNLMSEIAAQPLGAGIGFKTAGKISGDSVGLVAVDNGYGDLFLTLGPLGGLAFLGGLLLIVGQLRVARQATLCMPARRDGRLLAPLAMASIMAAGVMTVLVFSFAGNSGIWIWLSTGLALTPAVMPLKQE